jgi:Tfp pilus assembly protein PilN
MAHKLNLIPTDIIDREAWRRALFQITGAAVLGAVVIAIGHGGSRVWLASLRNDIAPLFEDGKHAASLTEEVARLRIERGRLLEIERMDDDMGRTVTSGVMLTELIHAMPPRVQLSRLEIKGPNTVTLLGTAMSNTDVGDFVATLNRSPRFATAELTFVRMQDGKDGRSITFEVRQTTHHVDSK